MSKIVLRRHEALGIEYPSTNNHSALARLTPSMIHTPDLRHDRKVTSVT